MINFTYFNSIKVRLEQMSRYESSTTTLFQFHKGAIRTVAAAENYAADA